MPQGLTSGKQMVKHIRTLLSHRSTETQMITNILCIKLPKNLIKAQMSYNLKSLLGVAFCMAKILGMDLGKTQLLTNQEEL